MALRRATPARSRRRCVTSSKLLGFGRLREAELAAAEIAPVSARVPDLAGGRRRLSYFQSLIDLYRGRWQEGLASLLRGAEAGSSRCCGVAHRACALAGADVRAGAHRRGSREPGRRARALSSQREFLFNMSTRSSARQRRLRGSAAPTRPAPYSRPGAHAEATPAHPWERGRARGRRGAARSRRPGRCCPARLGPQRHRCARPRSGGGLDGGSTWETRSSASTAVALRTPSARPPRKRSEEPGGDARRDRGARAAGARCSHVAARAGLVRFGRRNLEADRPRT